MKTLYLCVSNRTRSEYMGGSTRDTVTRLVWATDEEEASRLMRAAYDRDDPYGTSIRLSNTVCTPALGTPTQESA
jgi:hypothetical protein